MLVSLSASKSTCRDLMSQSIRVVLDTSFSDRNQDNFDCDIFEGAFWVLQAILAAAQLHLLRTC